MLKTILYITGGLFLTTALVLILGPHSADIFEFGVITSALTVSETRISVTIDKMMVFIAPSLLVYIHDTPMAKEDI